ncbi:MAG: N-carbamoylputrescine amidase [Kofleriaceae bacterium]
MAELVTIAALQTALTDDVATNVALVTDLVREAAGRGAQIILPSELFEGHYFCRSQREQDFGRARPADGHPTLRAFQELAKQLDVVIPVSFFERSGPEHYNSIAIIDADGTSLGVYRKSHIPDGPGYQEKFFFKPGNTGFRAFATKWGTIGVGICWDQWFPEAARAMTLAGADLLFYPTAIGSEPEDPELDSRDSWQRVMIGHAVANAVGVVAANRIGTEGSGPSAITFYGSSFICDARGDKLAELPRNEPGIALATLDLERLRAIRASMGFFRDRRPSLYGPLTK